MEQPTLKAERACHYCWVRKQRCDKLLPQCSRCVSKFVRCKYNDSDRTVTNLLGRSAEVAQIDSLLIRRDLCGFDISSSGERQILWAVCESESLTTEGIESQVFPRLVKSILEASGTSPHKVTTAYFANVHEWFPVLDQEKIEDRVHSFGLSEEPYNHALALVLLGMCLLNRSACDHPNHPVNSGIYRTTRRLFFILHLPTRDSKLALLQAGLLIAAYECGHGMAKQAYATLASCIALVQQLGASDTVEDKAISMSDKFQEELELCWCGIVLLDRTISLSMFGNRPPMLVHASQLPSSADFLKVIDPDLNLTDRVSRLRIRAKSALRIGDTLRAVYDNPHGAETGAPEAVLHGLLREHVLKNQEAAYPACEGIALALSAVVSIYKTTKEQNNIRENPKLALDIQFSYNILFEMCRVEGSLLHSRGASPQCVWFTGLACLYHAAIELDEIYPGGILSRDYDQLRYNLSWLVSRWRIGAVLSQRLEQIPR